MFWCIKNIISSWFFRSSLVFLIALVVFSLALYKLAFASSSVIVDSSELYIADTYVQFGGLQRKVVYASSNWYAFYSNDAAQIVYKKSANGTTWGSTVVVGTVDYGDTNPSVWLEGTTIYVAWIDTGTSTIEVETIDTANSDTQGTQCTSSSPGTLSSNFTVSVAVADDDMVYLAYSDTTGGTSPTGVLKLTFSGCSFTDITSGNGFLTNSKTTPDNSGNVGTGDKSLVLDSLGYPVVAYQGSSGYALQILHCNDANCSGGDESNTIPDSSGTYISSPSLVLDGSGYPVVSYVDVTNSNLKILHCNDANCSGGDESTTTPDTSSDVGRESSLKLDTSGYPVISYLDWTNGDLKILHCNDANCSGGDESITSPVYYGRQSSIILDSSVIPLLLHENWAVVISKSSTVMTPIATTMTTV